jgi:adenylate cyclase
VVDQRNPLGSRLLGRGTDSTRSVRVRVQLLLTAFIVLANLIGAVVVGALVIVVIPGPSVFTRDLLLVNAVYLPVYVTLAVGVGVVWGTRRALSVLRWAQEERVPTAADQAATLRLPWRLTRIQALLWGAAAVLFTTLIGLEQPVNIAKVAFTTLLGGMVVCANAYLLSEFALRPLAAKALMTGPPLLRPSTGVAGRSLLAWALGSGVPVAGLMLVAVFSLVRDDVSSTQLAITVLALGGVTLVFGLLLTSLSVNAVVAPLRTVREGLAEVERGRLDSEVVVFDGSELGQLQTGFNLMVRGLQEREQLRDLFGRHVGRDVAEAALASTPELGGEEREVAVFFIDLVGSTQLAARRPPTEVVALLNRFFSVVVDEVERCGGFVNKFEGDAALAVFGAPFDLEDPAGAALEAARCTISRLLVEVPECQAAAGVSAGPAVAGNIGDERRFEYTVIGDPVNEGARLSELAKTVDGRLVASERAVAAASAGEAAHWRTTETVQLRGRDTPTLLAVPRT